MTNRVWITRTQPAADRSADRWRDAGFAPIVAPLIDVISVPQTAPVSANTALIFTSANGVRHAGLTGDNRPVYAVGDATAQAAREQGFSNVLSAEGDWQDLSQIIDGTETALIHLSGREVRGRLGDVLKKRGLTYERRVVYETQCRVDWPVDPARIDSLALYSPKAAQTLMALPDSDLSHLTAYCLSANVAEPLSGLRVRLADRPNEAALIACAAAEG